MDKLKWTEQAPTKPGWYWRKARDLDSSIAEIVEVLVRPGHKYLAIIPSYVCNHTNRDFLPVERLPNLWAGPIEYPADG